jgi:Ti-type conjugative transfer relaxase TraA
MMSISRLGTLGADGAEAAAASHYYSEKGADYYVKDSPNNEHEGEWIGGGADRLGLPEGPDREALQLALAGYVAGRRVQNTGRPSRRMGWDLTFSAPKSVSLAWAFAAPAHQQKIRHAHVAATKSAYDYLESQAITRRGKAGYFKERAYLTSALFTHHTSREGDPQLHSHIVVPNFCVRNDGTTGTIESQSFFDLKMAAGALYQTELAYRMRALGYAVESGEKGTFRLSGVAPALEQQFSKRAREINRLSRERGIKTYKGTRQIVKSSRPAKKHTNLAERQATWQKEAKETGLSTSIERGAQSPSPKDQEAWIKENLAKPSQKLTERNSFFFERDHLLEMARASYGVLNAGQVLTAVAIARSTGHVVQLGKDEYGRQAFTTPEMAGVEREMVGLVRRMAEKTGFEADPTKVLGDIGYLSDEQKASVLSATGGQGIAVIQGRAGAGKTTTLTAIRTAYERAGWKVQGLAISGQAAHNMQKESGIPSRTIASWKLDQPPEPRTVLVVDEAGMVGSKAMREILERADKAGAKVILVGDERQLQPIDAGGALHAVDKELFKVAPEASSQIQTIRRQKEGWTRQVVHQAAQGKTAEALRELDERGKISLYPSAAAARHELVKEYLAQNKDGFERSLILTHRVVDANKINETVRQELREREQVAEDRLEVHNGQRQIGLAVGDRAMFLRNDYRLGVRNGQRGTVQGVQEKSQSLTIRTDEGEVKEVFLDKYKFLEYGWASTTHKAQGSTVDRAYVFGFVKESLASRQMTYVQISRAREDTRIYAVAGEHSIERAPLEPATSAPMEKTAERARAFQDMSRTWSRDAAKGTSQDFLIQQQMQKKIAEQQKEQGMER